MSEVYAESLEQNKSIVTSTSGEHALDLTSRHVSEKGYEDSQVADQLGKSYHPVLRG